MADNIIKVNVTANKTQRVTVSSANVGTEITASSDTGKFWAQNAKNWAVSENIVDGEDYSSKYYANKSKGYAQNAESCEAASRETYDNIIARSEGIITEIEELKEISEQEISIAVADGLTEINNKKNTAISDLEFVSEGEKEEIKDLANLIKENAEDIANRTSFAMFDTILKDHILTYEESKGLALQGTYVYKNAVAGSRYGYQDFYNKCLEEYNEATEYYGISWTQPVLSSDGVMGGESFAVEAYAFNGSDYPYQAFDSNNNTYWYYYGANAAYWITFYNPKALNVSKLDMAVTAYGSSVTANGTINVYGSNDNSSWTPLVTGVREGTYSGLGKIYNYTIDLSNNKNYYKYYKIENTTPGKNTDGYCGWLINNINITATQLTGAQHSNGHIFYDIAQKDQIDEIFNSTGSAWMYGIDTENERVFLPRDNEKIHGTLVKSYTSGTSWYRVYSDGWCEQGGELSVGGNTNTTVTLLQPYANAQYTANITGIWSSNDDYLFTVINRTSATFQIHSSIGATVPFQWSTAGYSEIPADEGVKNPKNCYICVGNTESVSTVTDVVEVTTTENDTLPLGYHFYQAGAQPSVSYLKSEGQWNYGNVYTTFYNEFVNKIGQDFASGKVVNYTEEYTDYDLVINQDNMTFRLPLLDGSEDLQSDKYIDLTLNTSGAKYTAPSNGWFILRKLTNAVDQYVELLNENTNAQLIINRPVSGSTAAVYMPCKKGDVVSAFYTAGGQLKYFRFVYAQGNGSLYFKVANAVQNLELLDAGEVLEAVNKINNNSIQKTNQADIDIVTNWMMPDFNNEIRISVSTNKIINIPCDGYFCPEVSPNGSFNMSPVGYAGIYTNTYQWTRGNAGYQEPWFPIAKGDYLIVTASSCEHIGFRPMKGAN